MKVQQIVHPEFTSNTYILSSENYNWVWLIDIGNFHGINQKISKALNVKGVFITHSHYDHIYGINKLIASYPECYIYASKYAREGLYSEKINLSYYHQDPIVFQGSNIRILKENDSVELFTDCILETIETPGHNAGCLTYRTGNYLFTGDSYIPQKKIVTKLKSGNKKASSDSFSRIQKMICDKTIICPGHGEMVFGK